MAQASVVHIYLMLVSSGDKTKDKYKVETDSQHNTVWITTRMTQKKL